MEAVLDGLWEGWLGNWAEDGWVNDWSWVLGSAISEPKMEVLVHIYISFLTFEATYTEQSFTSYYEVPMELVDSRCLGISWPKVRCQQSLIFS
jgi:hypothetical protein